jgi:adenosylmethionine-8-amino-7-oxononanoate aminotransferase
MLQSETHVFHRVINGQLPVAERGDGVYILDSEGNRYLDASSGAAVSCLGHSNKRVIESIKKQLDRVAFAHTGFFTSEPGEELADFPGAALARRNKSCVLCLWRLRGS